MKSRMSTGEELYDEMVDVLAGIGFSGAELRSAESGWTMVMLASELTPPMASLLTLLL